MDDLGAALALGLGLAGDGADHVVRQIDLLHLDLGHLDAPRGGVGVEHALQPQVDRLALAQQLVQFRFAQDRAERSLSQLRGRVEEVGHLQDGLLRVDDAEEDHGIHLHRDVVARHDVLGRHLQRFQPQRHAHHPVNRPEDDHQAGAFRLFLNAAQAEHHAAFVFGQDIDAREDVEQHYDYGHKYYGIHRFIPFRTGLTRVRLSI